MIHSVQSLKDRVRNFSKLTGLNHNQIIQNFMFEKFLERLSVSKYKDCFVLKGGCLLSSIMGVKIRSTRDIDFNITGINFNLNEIKKIVSDIIEINLVDNITFEIVNIEEIKEEQEYEGYRFTLLCKFENIKVNFHLDISTGDIMTPNFIKYSYKKLLEEEYISLMTYNFETIIAEKLQSILDKKIVNSRMKDYYDIYYFVNYRWNDLDIINLKRAILRTFEHRETLSDLSRAEEIINKIKIDSTMNDLWKMYREKYNYLCNIEFDDCLFAIQKILSIIEEC